MCIENLFSKMRRLKNPIYRQEDSAIIENLRESLKQCEEQYTLAEESLSSLRQDYEVQKEELRLTKEQNEFLHDEKQVLSNKVNCLETRCQSLSDNLNNLRQKAKEDSDYIVGTIIECIQNATVLDSEIVEKTQVMKYFNNHLINILSNMGIRPIDDIGIPANPQFHRIENIVDTDVPEQSGIISQSFGIGFKKGDDCIVEQPVEVYKYRK